MNWTNNHYEPQGNSKLRVQSRRGPKRSQIEHKGSSTSQNYEKMTDQVSAQVSQCHLPPANFIFNHIRYLNKLLKRKRNVNEGLGKSERERKTKSTSAAAF